MFQPVSSAAAMRSRLARCLMAGSAAIALLGCATDPLDAQWRNPQQQAVSLRGASVLVSCDANELVIRQICQDQLAVQVAAVGGRPIKLTDAVASGNDLAARGRAVGARAVFSVAVAAEIIEADRSGVSVGFGMGSFGFGHGGFGGVGVSAPISGQTRYNTGYAGNASLIDAGNGSLWWTAKARAASSSSTESQMEALAKALAEGAVKAGFF